MAHEAEITELRLGPPRGVFAEEGGGCKSRKRVFAELGGVDEHSSTNESGSGGGGPAVVGWPPVCSYRQRKATAAGKKKAAPYVKVSMDGAPILRKVDLRAFEGYADLTAAMERLFGRNEYDGSEYVQIYEDKDGDWMLVGDVPWGMFMETCRRLRIMKNTRDSRVM